MASIPKRVEDRLVAGIKKFQPILRSRSGRDVNESETDVALSPFGHLRFGDAKSHIAKRTVTKRSSQKKHAIKMKPHAFGT